MSRKGPASSVTCCYGRSWAADLRKWPFGSFTLVSVDAAESPRKVPENSHYPQPLFRFHAGLWARCGLVSVHRWSALNELQHALLERLAAGEDPAAWDPGDWRSAYALCNRGLLSVRRRGGEVCAEVTEAGRFYFQHGRHLDDPAYTGSSDQAVSAGTAPSAAGVGWRGSTGRRRVPMPYSERPDVRASCRLSQEPHTKGIALACGP